MPRRRRSHRKLASQQLESRRLLAGDAPTFAEVGDQTVEVGAPLHVPIDGFDSDGGPLVVSVEVSNPDAVAAEVITGNRSLRLDVASFGIMIFELYEARAPRPTQRIIELAEDGFYDGLIFHRVDSDFVLQSGSPDGTGTTGSDLGTFDDQFHPDLQHNQVGTLSFAKTSADDSNNSQFFVTATETRFLDFNHSVFGQLVEGESVRQAISEVAIDIETERPLTDVVITSATIFEDIENSVVQFRAIQPGVESEVTITITDAQGNQSSETITVGTIEDQNNAGPYLADLPRVVLSEVGQSVSLQAEALDNEGDDVFFSAQFLSNPFGTTGSFDAETGLLELDPTDTFVGSFGVQLETRANPPQTAHVDTQQIQFEFVDNLPTPTSIDLAAESDTGESNDDDVTNASDLLVQVGGVTEGAIVEIVDASSQTVLGSVLVDADAAIADAVDIEISLPGDSGNDDTVVIIARQRTGALFSDPSGELVLQIDRSTPQLTSTSIADHVFAGSAYVETLTADESGVTWGLVSGPDGLTIDPQTGQIDWTPTPDVRGLQTVSISIQDVAGNTSQSSLTINVTSRFFNPNDPLDVDGLGTVTSLDALLIINAISQNGGEISLPETDGSSPSTLQQDLFYNTNNDTAITPLDALIVINEIARRGTDGAVPDAESLTPLPAATEDSDSDHTDRDQVFSNLLF